MATAAVQAPPGRVPTPRSLPTRTSSPQSELVAAAKSSRNTSSNGASASIEDVAPSQQAAAPRRGLRTASAGPLSDRATAFLVRRILCPQQADKGKSSPASIEDILPPLTSRNDVDLQLYALIAIILREYVQNWYAKITPDATFVAEIVQIIAHITRALEQRLRKVDLESLLFDELPELLDRHITAYRVAHDPIAQPPVRTDPRKIYHSLCPLPALSPVPRPEDPDSVAAQAENEAAYRQLLVSAFLAILLPTEDLENRCLTALVGQIFSELIIGNAVANRLSEPWLVWELFIIAARTAGRRNSAEADGRHRSERSRSTSQNGRHFLSIQSLFWTILQFCFLAVSFIRTAAVMLVTSGSLPRRVARDASPRKDANMSETSAGSVGLTHTSEADPQPSKIPVLAFRCWSAVSNLAEMGERVPWLCGTLSMLQWMAVMGPGQIANVDGRLDRFLSYGIHKHILDAANLPPLLRTVRGALFPNNLPAGKPSLVPPASGAELRALRRRCASALWGLVPKRVGRLFFGGGLLLSRRASPVASLRKGKAEGSAELKAAGRRKHDKGRGKGKGMGSLFPSATTTTTTLMTGADGNMEIGTRSETAPPPPPHSRRRGPRAGAGSPPSLLHQSRRSAPAPSSPKTGGQGLVARAADASAGADSPLGSSLLSNLADVEASASEDAADGGTPHDTGDRAADDGGVDDEYQIDETNDVDEDEDEDENILEEIEQGILDVFSDAYCNKHLVYGILELILVRLLPELTEMGVLELWEERLPSMSPSSEQEGLP